MTNQKFCGEIRKTLCDYLLLTGVMADSNFLNESVKQYKKILLET